MGAALALDLDDLEEDCEERLTSPASRLGRLVGEEEEEEVVVVVEVVEEDDDGDDGAYFC